MRTQISQTSFVGGSRRLDTLQLMRAVAATMVVALHAHANWNFSLFPLPTEKLGAGVDLFFVISGFVIVYASQSYFTKSGGRSAFLLRRLIRIVPLYWFALTLRLVALAAAAILGIKSFPSLESILTSYFFIPYDSMGYGDRYPFPILDLGWTLNYEMFFYAIFALFIVLPMERAVLYVAAALVSGVLVGLFFNVALPFSFWLQPIVLEFVGGMFLAVAYLRGVSLNPVIGAAVGLCGLAVWSLIDLRIFESYGNPGFYSFPRLSVLGGGAFLLMAAATLTREIGLPRFARPISALGDSSYALYLLHPFIFLVLKGILSVVEIQQQWSSAIYISVIGITITIAHLFHLFVEKPTTEWLRSQFKTRRAKTVTS